MYVVVVGVGWDVWLYVCVDGEYVVVVGCIGG